MVTRHLLLRQLLRALFRLRCRVRVRVSIGFYVRFRVRFRVGYSVESRVEVSHSISVWNLERSNCRRSKCHGICSINEPVALCVNYLCDRAPQRTDVRIGQPWRGKAAPCSNVTRIWTTSPNIWYSLISVSYKYRLCDWYRWPCKTKIFFKPFCRHANSLTIIVWH